MEASILTLVTEYLDGNSIRSALLVCKLWTEIIKNSDSVWIQLLQERKWLVKEPQFHSRKGEGFRARFLRLVSIGKSILEHQNYSTKTISVEEIFRTPVVERCSVLSITSKGRNIVFGCSNGTLCLWFQGQNNHNINKSSYLKDVISLPAHNSCLSCVSMNKAPDPERWVVTGSFDGSVNLWKLLKDGNGIVSQGKLGNHQLAVRCIVLDGNFAVSGSKDHSISLWDLQNKRCCGIFKGHHGVIHSLALTSKFIISASSDSKVIVWDRFNPLKRAVLKGKTRGWITCVCCNNEIIVSASAGEIKVWEMPLLTDLVSLEDDISLRMPRDFESKSCFGHIGTINCLKLIGNQYIISGGDDTTIHVWKQRNITEEGNRNKLKNSLLNFESLYTLKGHLDWVNCIARHPDVPVIASGDATGMILLWNYEKGILLKKVKECCDVPCLGLSFTRKMLTSADWHGNVTCFNFTESPSPNETEANTAATNLEHNPRQNHTQNTLSEEERQQRFPHSALLRKKI